MRWQVLACEALSVVAMVLSAGVGYGAEVGPPGRGMEGRPPMRMPVGMGALPGADLPAVREEMQRLRQALLEVFTGHVALAREIDRSLAQLRAAGAEEAELEEAAKRLAPLARELAEKQAAALATHYENLAKIYKPDDEAKRTELLDQLAQDLIKRMARPAEARPQAPFGPGGRQPGDRRFPGGGEGRPGARRFPGGGGDRRPGERRGPQEGF